MKGCAKRIMFWIKLKDLYKKNVVLAEEYSFEEYYPLLRRFIAREVNLGSEYLSPYRFSLYYGISPGKSIRLFLGLADNPEIIRTCFKYQCEECDSINIIEDEKDLLEFSCYECGFEDSLATPDYFSEVKVIFKISYEILEEFKEDLKENPLSNNESNSTALEEGIDVDVSFEAVGELNGLEDKIIGEDFEARVRNILMGDIL